MDKLIDITTPEGLEELRRINPELAKEWDEAMDSIAKKISDAIDDAVLKDILNKE